MNPCCLGEARRALGIYELPLVMDFDNYWFRGHCLDNLHGSLTVERLVRSMAVIVSAECFEPMSDSLPTADPRRIEAVSPDLQRLKPLFDVVSGSILKLTAQSHSIEGSQLATAINQKLGV